MIYDDFDRFMDKCHREYLVDLLAYINQTVILIKKPEVE